MNEWQKKFSKRKRKEPVESGARGFNIIRREAEVLLETINDSTSTSMDAEVLEGQLEVWHIGWYFLCWWHLSCTEIDEELQLFCPWQHHGSHCWEIDLQGFSYHCHELFAWCQSHSLLGSWAVLHLLRVSNGEEGEEERKKESTCHTDW